MRAVAGVDTGILAGWRDAKARGMGTGGICMLFGFICAMFIFGFEGVTLQTSS